jgi:hypothetical protein
MAISIRNSEKASFAGLQFESGNEICDILLYKKGSGKYYFGFTQDAGI